MEYVKKLNALAGIEVKITPFSLVDFVSGNFISFLELRTGRKKQYCFAHKLLFHIVMEKQILGYFLLIFDLRNIEMLNSRLP